MAAPVISSASFGFATGGSGYLALAPVPRDVGVTPRPGVTATLDQGTLAGGFGISWPSRTPGLMAPSLGMAAFYRAAGLGDVSPWSLWYLMAKNPSYSAGSTSWLGFNLTAAIFPLIWTPPGGRLGPLTIDDAHQNGPYVGTTNATVDTPAGLVVSFPNLWELARFCGFGVDPWALIASIGQQPGVRWDAV